VSKHHFWKDTPLFDLTLAPDLDQLTAELPTLAAEQVRPLAATHDETTKAASITRPQVPTAESERGLPEAVTQLVDSWTWLPGTDAFQSGTDVPLAFCLAAEGLAWGDPGVALGWVTSRQVAWLIAACGTSEQKERYLPQLASSSTLPVSLLLFEGYGRAPSEIETTARPSAGGWVLNGTKHGVMNAGQAELAVIVARDESGALRAFILDDPSRITYRGTEDRWLALGSISPATYADIDNVEVPAEAALELEGLAEAISVCRLAQTSVLLGVADSATRYAADWAKTRIAFGRPLVGFQGVAFPLAELIMEIEAAKMARIDVLTELASGTDAELLTSRFAARTNHALRNATREGIQLMGVHGVITDHPQERNYRSAGLLASIDFDPLLDSISLSNS
jgi:alkylation response protein AidB-like acyl-CoA dehydrogenase